MTPSSTTNLPTPQPHISQQNPDQSRSSFSGVGFVGEIPAAVAELLGTKMSLYGFEQQDRLGEISETVINSLQLSLLDEVGPVEIYSSDQYNLSINHDQKRATLSRKIASEQNLEIETISLSRAQVDNLINTSADYVDNIFPQNNLTPLESSIRFFDGDVHLSPSTSLSCTYVEIPFTQILEGLPVYLDQKGQEPVLVLITSLGKVQKVVLSPTRFHFTPSTSSTIISVEEAIHNINTNNVGSVITWVAESHLSTNIEEIVGANLTEVSLEYRIDSTTQLAYPFYRFSGSLVNTNEETVFGEIITPAIQIQLDQ